MEITTTFEERLHQLAPTLHVMALELARRKIQQQPAFIHMCRFSGMFVKTFGVPYTDERRCHVEQFITRIMKSIPGSEDIGWHA